jgi:hypothetical protein
MLKNIKLLLTGLGCLLILGAPALGQSDDGPAKKDDRTEAARPNLPGAWSLQWFSGDDTEGGQVFNYYLILRADKTFELKRFYKKFKNRCSAIFINESRGSYAAAGEEMELKLDKNHWRLDYSCTPADNKELNEKPETVKFKFRLERTERNEERLCLVNDRGETCYFRVPVKER